MTRTTTAANATATEAETPRRRWRRRAIAAVATGAAALALGACTPSGYQAERLMTARIHYLYTGSVRSADDVRCATFDHEEGGPYTGTCRIADMTYALTSHYNGDLTNITAGQWGSPSATCTFLKAGDRWVIYDDLASNQCE